MKIFPKILAMSFYVLLQLMRLPASEPAHAVLLSRRVP